MWKFVQKFRAGMFKAYLKSYMKENEDKTIILTAVNGEEVCFAVAGAVVTEDGVLFPTVTRSERETVVRVAVSGGKRSAKFEPMLDKIEEEISTAYGTVLCGACGSESGSAIELMRFDGCEKAVGGGVESTALAGESESDSEDSEPGSGITVIGKLMDVSPKDKTVDFMAALDVAAAEAAAAAAALNYDFPPAPRAVNDYCDIFEETKL